MEIGQRVGYLVWLEVVRPPSFDDISYQRVIMAIDGVYQKRVMNLTDDDIYHIKGSKKT